MTGRVSKANSKGFGFIEAENGIDFFFHRSDFDGNWKRLTKDYVDGKVITVEFENDSDPRHEGPKAKNVRLLSAMGDANGA